MGRDEDGELEAKGREGDGNLSSPYREDAGNIREGDRIGLEAREAEEDAAEERG